MLYYIHVLGLQENKTKYGCVSRKKGGEGELHNERGNIINYFHI